MIFEETKISGVYLVGVERHYDERGFFARSWCAQEWAARGLSTRLAQCSLSFNAKKGTLRGIHYQAKPYAECKLVRCTRGSLYDVAVDLRVGSPTYLKWVGAELSAENHRALYIPEGCAHGLLTLKDDTEVFYQISEFYYPEAGRGVRWNDPAFGIEWPFEPAVISERDRTYPDFGGR
jgi:dTDP-4-dehydrorhamnose 3,5-epimerase